MTTGLKAQTLGHMHGVSWEDLFAIDAGGLTNATRANFQVEILVGNGVTRANCFYSGSGALTLAEFNTLPIGSTILAYGLTTRTLYVLGAAATWYDVEFAAV